MDILDRIEDQVKATGLPLFAITLAAVPCPDTPLILTLHWHGFIREKLADIEEAEPVAYSPIPSSALQLNETWSDIVAVDRAALDAAWELGAWDVQRAERIGCMRAGADARESLECLQAFGAFPYPAPRETLVVAETPDAEDLIDLAAQRGYLMWMFRPVKSGIWGEYADDATLNDLGGRPPPCPCPVILPSLAANRKTVYRLGRPTADASH